jgi:hypothetical protein
MQFSIRAQHDSLMREDGASVILDVSHGEQLSTAESVELARSQFIVQRLL